MTSGVWSYLLPVIWFGLLAGALLGLSLMRGEDDEA